MGACSTDSARGGICHRLNPFSADRSLLNGGRLARCTKKWIKNLSEGLGVASVRRCQACMRLVCFGVCFILFRLRGKLGIAIDVERRTDRRELYL